MVLEYFSQCCLNLQFNSVFQMILKAKSVMRTKTISVSILKACLLKTEKRSPLLQSNEMFG